MSIRWVTLWVRPLPLWKYVCPFIGLHCGCVPPLWKYVCPFVGLHCGCVPPPLWKYVCPFVGLHCGCAPPPSVCPFIGSLHAAYSALRHFFLFFSKPFHLTRKILLIFGYISLKIRERLEFIYRGHNQFHVVHNDFFWQEIISQCKIFLHCC